MINTKQKGVRVCMIIESPPEDKKLADTNTIKAFNNAGIAVENINDITMIGVHITTAVKTPRKASTFPSHIIEKSSYLLEEELKKFPNLRVILLMGDTAIKSLNFISKRVYKTKAITAGSTYKIRGGKFYFGKIRVFPSYLQTGKNFLIEKSKQRMVAEDIKNAFKLLGN